MLDETSGEDHRLRILEDPFFLLSYTAWNETQRSIVVSQL